MISGGGRLRSGGFGIDLDRGLLTGPDGARRIEPRVLGVLSCLLEAGGRLVTHEELHARVWAGTHVTQDSVSAAVYHLRKALGESAAAPPSGPDGGTPRLSLAAPVEREPAAAKGRRRGPLRSPWPYLAALAAAGLAAAGLAAASLGAFVEFPSPAPPDPPASQALTR